MRATASKETNSMPRDKHTNDLLVQIHSCSFIFDQSTRQYNSILRKRCWNSCYTYRSFGRKLIWQAFAWLYFCFCKQIVAYTPIFAFIVKDSKCLPQNIRNRVVSDSFQFQYFHVFALEFIHLALFTRHKHHTHTHAAIKSTKHLIRQPTSQISWKISHSNVDPSYDKFHNVPSFDEHKFNKEYACTVLIFLLTEAICFSRDSRLTSQSSINKHQHYPNVAKRKVNKS